MSLLELKEVTVSFAFPDGRPALLALNQVNLSVAQGELVALVGPSGCGKTTALNVLAGQVVPTSGQVRLAGEPVQGILPSVGYISQADTLLPWLLTSLRTGLGLSLSGAIVGEYLGSTRGMGWLLSAAGDVFNAQRVLCCVLILVILIILLDGVVRLLEARLLRWR